VWRAVVYVERYAAAQIVYDPKVAAPTVAVKGETAAPTAITAETLGMKKVCV
jgi:hypothetical protein